ncbi:hypothetical protein D9C73_000763 [Collichthys lucidus]|uniref:Uncharacterized protein n=1 Tax=Collichthys lucidus TaxID=240159 RepID=A0A4U5U1J4_COLLU|nr:hypothetical protein D9C73_000763 [Collichthys lucidus]
MMFYTEPAASAHARKGLLRLGRRNHPGHAENSAATASGASVVEQRSRGTETLEPVQPHGGDTTREARHSESGSTDPEARRREPDTRSLESEVQPAREGVNSHPLTANEHPSLLLNPFSLPLLFIPFSLSLTPFSLPLLLIPSSHPLLLLTCK